MSEAPDGAAVVIRSDHGRVRLLTLNRPQRRNAIDESLRELLTDELDLADADESVRVVVISGAGKDFCSGGDVSGMAQRSRAETAARVESAARSVRRIWSMPKPVLAAVEGHAVGAGTALAAACDRVIAARTAVFHTPFTAVGLAGDMGVFYSLPTRVGVARARQMLLFPRPLSGEEAAHIGLVDEAVEPSTALARALADAEQLAHGPSQAIRMIKQMFARVPVDPFDVIALESANQTVLGTSSDFAEGVAAFRERRRPRFA